MAEKSAKPNKKTKRQETKEAFEKLDEESGFSDIKQFDKREITPYWAEIWKEVLACQEELRARAKQKGTKGAPTKYHERWPELMLRYFMIPASRPGIRSYYKKDGTSVEEEVEIPNPFPLFEEFFAGFLDVDFSCAEEWRKVHKDFSAAYKKCKDFQKGSLIQNGIAGRFNPAFSIFTAKNITDMRDKVEVDGELTDRMKRALDKFSDFLPKD